MYLNIAFELFTTCQPLKLKVQSLLKKIVIKTYFLIKGNVFLMISLLNF